MRAAAAQIIAQRFQHLVLGRVWRALQQRLGRDDHAVEAIAALRGLLVDEGLLHGIGVLARAEAFERHNVAAGAALDRDHAGARRDAVDQHGAGAAFAEPAAIFRSVQFEIVAQHIKQGGVGRGVDVMGFAVDGQAHRALRHAPLKPRCAAKSRWTPREDTVCIQTCKPGDPALQRDARFMNTAARQMRFLCGKARFFAGPA